MNFNITALAAGLVGMIIGAALMRLWLGLRLKAARAPQPASAPAPSPVALSLLEGELSQVERSAAAAQQALMASQQEYQALLLTLDQQQARTAAAQQDMAAAEHQAQEAAAQREQALRRADALLKEIDTLEEITRTAEARFNSLTQQIQQQEGELRRLVEAGQRLTHQIEAAQAHIDGQAVPMPSPTPVEPARPTTLKGVRRTLPPSLIDPLPPKEPPALPPPDGHQDDLTQIPGLADLYAQQLYALGIHSYGQLAACTPELLQQVLNIPGHFSPNLAAWISEAARRIQNP